MNRSLGFLCLALGISSMTMMPFLELVPVSGTDITVARGIPGVIVLGLAWIFLKGVISLPSRNTFLLSLFFALATLGLFEGVKAWGANYTIILLDLAVLVPLTLRLLRGERVHTSMIIAFAIAVTGGVLSLRVWSMADLALTGLLWSVMALLFNGLFIEFAGKKQQVEQNIHTKVFWQSAGLVVVGMFLGGSVVTSLTATQAAVLVGVTLLSGLLNFYFFFTALRNLDRVFVGMLVLAITPLTILVSYLFLGKTMGLDQLLGVVLSLSAVGYIALSGSKEEEKKPAKER